MRGASFARFDAAVPRRVSGQCSYHQYLNPKVCRIISFVLYLGVLGCCFTYFWGSGSGNTLGYPILTSTGVARQFHFAVHYWVAVGELKLGYHMMGV